MNLILSSLVLEMIVRFFSVVISGNLILEMNGLLGQWQAEYALEHQDQLSDEFQRFSLVFPGTVWKSPDGNHQVPCLTYRQGQWDLIFGILEGGFDSRDVMASLD